MWWAKSTPVIGIRLINMTKIGGAPVSKVPISSDRLMTDHGEGNARFSKKYISRLAMGNKESK